MRPSSSKELCRLDFGKMECADVLGLKRFAKEWDVGRDDAGGRAPAHHHRAAWPARYY